MIQMRAVVAFDRNGKHLQVGDLFSAYPIEAASLRYMKKAEFVSGARPAPSQSYGTRHMTARTPGAGSPPEAPRAATTAPTQRADAESAQTTDGSRSRRSARSQQLANRQMDTSGASEK